jgi:serine/threonine-protein kinase RsbW
VLSSTSYTADEMRDATATALLADRAMTPFAVRSALRVPADMQAVGFVRSAIACVLEREDWPAESAGRVLLASNEALANAIEHGSPDGGLVEVDLVVTYERADITIIDEGVPGTAVPHWPSEPPPITAERGRGLIIISRLADDFDMAAAGDGTQVRVGFWRDERGEGEAAGARAAA